MLSNIEYLHSNEVNNSGWKRKGAVDDELGRTWMPIPTTSKTTIQHILNTDINKFKNMKIINCIHFLIHSPDLCARNGILKYSPLLTIIFSG
jgi:hypothetical protein